MYRKRNLVLGGAFALWACHVIPITIASPVGGARVPSSQVSVHFTAPRGDGPVSFTCQLDSQPAVPCRSPHAFTAVADGPHTVRVHGTLADHEPGTQTVSLLVDTQNYTRVKQVAAGVDFTCALLTTGAVRC